MADARARLLLSWRGGHPAGGGTAVAGVAPLGVATTSFIVLAVVLIFVSFVAGIGSSGFGHDWSDTPKAWDPQVAPIAARVRRRRGVCEFKHPVKVNYLTPADFEKKVTSSPDDSKKQREQIEQGEALLRATGLLGGTSISATP